MKTLATKTKLKRKSMTVAMTAAALLFAASVSGTLVGVSFAQAPATTTKPAPATTAPATKPALVPPAPAAATAAPASAPAKAAAPAAAVAPASAVTPQTPATPAARAAAGTAGKMQVTPGGVKYEDQIVGAGAVAKTGQTVTVFV